MDKILIHEVGMRDGLQMEHESVPTEKKVIWIKKLLESGVDIIQIGSFVHPKYVPQMADTDELFRYFKQPENRPANIILSGLVLNEKGLERGLACGVDMFCMGVSASETHSQKNTRMSIDEALARIIEMAKMAQAEGKSIQASVQSAFGCGFEGIVPANNVLRIVDAYLEAGIKHISLADTAGHANPIYVENLFSAILEKDDEIECTCHFHNTFGMAMANCFAAWRTGVVAFEASFAGLGGCPYTAVAGGNVCSEDLVHMFQQMNQRKEIDIDPLISVAKEAELFFSREMPGMVYKTGAISDQLSSDTKAN